MVARRAFPFLIVFLAGATLTLLVEPLLHLDSPAVTNSVTLAGTIATAVATVALAWFAAVQVWEARRQQRGVAAALLEEVNRIRGELGARPREGQNPAIIDSHTAGADPDQPSIVTDAMTPEIHEWFHSVIPQIAESDPAILGSFLTLDRHLFNYRDRVRILVLSQEAVRESRETLGRWISANPNAVAMDAVMVRQKAEYDVRLTEANLDAAKAMAITLYRACHATLDSLTRQLRSVLA